MRIDPGKAVYGATLLLFAATITVHLVRDRFRKELKRCTERGFGSVVQVDPTTNRPLVRLFPADSPPLEFWHSRPFFDENGERPAHGTKLVVYYDPEDPWRGPHILSHEIKANARSARNLAVLAIALAVTGCVLLACGVAPAA